MDFSDQYIRLNRANCKGAELGASIQGWINKKPWSIEAKIDENRLGWGLILRISEQPPLDEWGLIFGEAVHQLRSMLDNIVVNIGRVSGITDPKILKLLQFPICGSADEWGKQKNRIEKLPINYQNAIENVQPFKRYEEGGTPDQDLLLILRDLSNQDKHHLQIKPLIDPVSLQHNFSVEYASDTEAGMNIPPKVEIFSPTFKDGDMVLRQSTVSKIVKVRGGFNISAQIDVVIPNKGSAPLTQTLGALCYYNGVVLKFMDCV